MCMRSAEDDATYVEALVNLESAGTRILFVTAIKLANEWFHARVGQLVRLQVALRDELLRALLARERPLARVGSHVRFQVARLLKLLETLLERADQ